MALRGLDFYLTRFLYPRMRPDAVAFKWSWTRWLWLFALPNRGLRQPMSPLEFQSATYYRLLVPQFAPGSVCGQQSYAAVINVHGYNALMGVVITSFPSQSGLGCVIWPYDQRMILSVKDSPVTCLDIRSGRVSALCRADLPIARDKFDYFCVDVMVVSPLVTNNQSQVVVGWGFETSEIQQACTAILAGKKRFQAFAVDLLGVTAEESSGLLRRILTRLVHFGGCPTYKAVASCFRRGIVADQLEVARQCIACCQEVSD